MCFFAHQGPKAGCPLAALGSVRSSVRARHQVQKQWQLHSLELEGAKVRTVPHPGTIRLESVTPLTVWGGPSLFLLGGNFVPYRPKFVSWRTKAPGSNPQTWWSVGSLHINPTLNLNLMGRCSLYLMYFTAGPWAPLWAKGPWAHH